MAYENPANPNPMTAAETMTPGAGMREKPMEASGGEGTIHIGPDMLPPGMKLNKGDIVEFKVIGEADADGDWPIEYNYGDKGKEGMAKQGETESWEEGLKKHMSPRSGGDEMQQSAY